MQTDIKAIFLDLGNTLRFALKDELHMAIARKEIVNLLGTDENPEAFCKKLDDRYISYRDWAFETNREAPEAELWTRWLVPDFSPEKVIPISEELTYQYRQTNGRRVVVAGAREVIEELIKRGYKMGIISNLISTKEIPEWLQEEKYQQYFSSVVLSSVCGIRKPDPEIFLRSASQVGLPPESCVYVGDNLNRDVTGAREAGFGQVILVIPPEKMDRSRITDQNKPDLILEKFDQLLEIFK